MSTNLVKNKRVVVKGTHTLSNHADLHIECVFSDTIDLRFANEGEPWCMMKRDMQELICVLQEITDAMEDYSE